MKETSTAITVSELTFAIKNQLESRFINLAVQGEISNVKLHSSGHLYFDLKDDKAKISAVLFNCSIQPLPKEGDQIIAYGSLSLYPPHGKYQLLVKKLEFKGIGEYLLKLEELKKLLHARGWFAKEHKKALPAFPKKIGVVTSPTGAVIRDIIHVLSRRFSGFHLILNPVRVQGNEAAFEIANAIQEFNRYKLVDVLIVARGGGSIEDLWPFNEESVAKAIFESEIPVISAVGHETDVTIADFVADVRAPTPSSAAEIVLREKKETLDSLFKMRKNLSSLLLSLLMAHKEKLYGIARHPLFSSSLALLSLPWQKLDEIKNRLEVKIRQSLLERKYRLDTQKKRMEALKPTAQIKNMQQKTTHLEKQILHAFLHSLQSKKQKLQEIVQRLAALDPKNVLTRGYCILFAINKPSVIVSAQELREEMRVKAKLWDGEANLRVEHEGK